MKRERNLIVLKKMTVSLIFLMLLITSTGCSTTSVYVLDQKELIRVKSGETVEAKYDGWLLSDRAVDRVMNAKIAQTKL